MKTSPKTLIVFLLLGLTSCQLSRAPEASQTLRLASSKEKDVDVVIRLTRDQNQQASLSATFIPLESGLHLYSKDIPKHGVEGLGRPTLLELEENSQITQLSDLMESVPPQAPDFEPKSLLVYPPGEVTLSMPVVLPAGTCWLDENVLVTYMACSNTGCRPPVVDKKIEVHVPCADAATNP